MNKHGVRNSEHESDLKRNRNYSPKYKVSKDKLRFTQFAIDKAGDPAFWMDSDAQFFYVNDAACHSLGYPREELLTMTVHDIAPNFPKSMWKRTWNILKMSKTIQFESIHRTKNKKIIPVEITASYIERNGKEHSCFCARDITDRKVSELSLRNLNSEWGSGVEVSTSELLKTNESLIDEMNERRVLNLKSQIRAEELKVLYENLSRRNKDLEILNTITQAVHKSLDIKKVYRIALDMTTDLENVDMACIYLVDIDANEAVLQDQRNFPTDYLRRASRIPYPRGITWKVIKTAQVLNIENAQEDPKIHPAGRDMGHHGVLGIPITSEGKVIGVLWFLSYKERRFDRQEVNLLSSIGNQISEAIAKANLYLELSKKNRYESIISAVTRSVHQSIDLQEVLENAVDALSKNMESVKNVSIFIVDGEEAVLRSYRGYDDLSVNRMKRIPYPKGFTWKTIIEGKPSYVADVDKDSFIGPAGKEFGTKSYASMPITLNVKAVGALNINSLHKNAFDEEELKLLEVVAQQIGVAIKNAKQAEYLRISEEALQKTNEELELRVKERTETLSEKNKELKKEIEKRKNAEARIKASLYEKELLVKEIQHRVKNNLQVITSLLDLQNEYVKDGTFKNILADVQNRIRSMALIHEHIFQSKNVAKIDFEEYLRELVTYLFNSYGASTEEIRLKIEIREASLNVNRAIMCGLIINELVSNSLKHAFPKRERGQRINIELYSESERCVLSVSDNGIGFPKDLNFRKTESLGLQLVLSLTRQLEGSLQLNRKPGTEFKIVFPEK